MGEAGAWLFGPVARALLAADSKLKVLPSDVWCTGLQYNRYDGSKRDHFDVFHVDEVGRTSTTYKELSIVIFLSQPEIDFVGGNFEVEHPSGKVQNLPATANSAVVFRARSLRHRVTTVTEGCRRTLVAWATTCDVSQTCESCVHFKDVLE